MANRVISIEIGREVTHVVETDFKVKNPKVYGSFSFATPSNEGAEEGKVDGEEFKKRLEEGLKEGKIKTRKAVFSIASSRIASRDVVIPHVKENRISALLHSNSKEYFPVDLEQYQLCYRILEQLEEGKEKKYKLMVLAVPNNLIQFYQNLASQCNLQLTALDYVGNATTQMMKKLVDKSLYAAVKIDEDATMVSVVKDGNIILQRNFSYGIEDAVNVVQKSGIYGENLSFMETLAVMRENNCVFAGEDSSQMQELQEDIQEAFRAIEGNVSRTMNFYTSNNGGEEIEEIMLYGLGADIMGLTELLSENLSAKIVSGELTENIPREKSDTNKDYHPLAYLSCLGAMISPMEFKFSDGEEKGHKAKSKEKKSADFYAKKVLEGCIIAAVVLVLAVVPKFVYLKVKNAQLQKERNQQNYLMELYEEHQATEEDLKKAKQLYEGTVTTTNGMGDFWAEMEENMPSSIRINSFTSDSEKATIEIVVASKKEAAKVLEAFSEFKTLESFKISEIVDVSDEVGNSGVTFTLECYYVNGTGEDGKDTETTVDEDVDTLTSGETEQEAGE